MYIFSQSSVGSQELGNTLLLAFLKESTVITFMQISFENIVQPLPIKVLKFDTVVAIYCTETSKRKKGKMHPVVFSPRHCKKSFLF